MDFLATLVYPTDFSKASSDFDELIWSYLESATGLSIPRSNMGGGFECPGAFPINSLDELSFQQHLTRLPLSKGGLGLRSVAETSGPAFLGRIGALLALLH